MAETTLKTGYQASVTEQQLVRDVSDVIWHSSESRNSPILTLGGGKLYLDGKSTPQEVPSIIKKEKAAEYKFDIIEKDSLARNWQINGAIASDSTATFVFDSTTGIQAGMLLRGKSASAPEIVFVTAVNANGTDITVRRNLGSTTYQVSDDTVFECVGFAQKEGGDKRAIRAQIAAPKTRYTQIFKNTFGITHTLMNSETLMNISAWEEEMLQAAQQHQLDKELALWTGPGVDSSTDADSATVYLTRGILNELGATYTTDCGGGMDEEFFFGTVSEDCFAYGPSKKILLADNKFVSRINKWALVRQQLQPKETKYGLAISELITAHGTFDIIHCGTTSKFMHNDELGFALCLDPDRVVIKYLPQKALGAGDTAYEEGIETPGSSRKEAHFVSQIGLSVRSLKHHRIIKNI